MISKAIKMTDEEHHEALQEEEGQEQEQEEHVFTVQVMKTSKGFGLYFTKQKEDAKDLLVNDGFVEEDAEIEVLNNLKRQLQLGDVLIGVNDVDCTSLAVAEVIQLLRSAPEGSNELRFRRVVTTKEEKPTDGAVGTIRQSFFGAIRKVKSRIKAEIEGDEDEQLETALFEKQWLQEFERLKTEEKTKWETCTYTADEFCGLLYHSSDWQQKEYLLREYPTLMENWKDADLRSSALRVHPDWPAALKGFEETVEYSGYDQVPASSQTTSVIACTPELAAVLEGLRTEFMWLREHVAQFTNQLEAMKIFTCTAFRQAIDDRHRTMRFERTLEQNPLYPRLSKSLLHYLYSKATEEEKQHESMESACMEPLKVNNPAPKPPVVHRTVAAA